MQDTIQELEAFLAQKRAGYNFDREYKLAERQLLLMKNPKGNYDVARRAAMSHYLGARRWGSSKEYRDWGRRFALGLLWEIREEYRALGILEKAQ